MTITLVWMQCSHESPLLLTRNNRRSSMVTLAGLEPATSPAPVNKDALSPLSYSVIVIFMNVYGGARADTCPARTPLPVALVDRNHSQALAADAPHAFRPRCLGAVIPPDY